MTTKNNAASDAQRVELAESQGDARAQFEAWAHAQSYRGGNIITDRDADHPDVYACPNAQLTWQCWKAALAARQPGAQEPVGEVYQGSARNPQARLSKPLPIGALLYAAPPAQGIDLGQLRALAEQWKQLEYPFSYEGQQAQRAADACRADLLALIDQRDAAPGVGNG
ncbi:hypothetical protein HMPREF3113_10330 [Stenotrophomonas sp. HMSC10F06]|uniref:hypothetical protein n=1 Tax=Stenotrophomonas sp. HMSC10F06 TaxID=1581081 RepID=UPI0008A37FF2|nr:hypothetical protein [Stenotrophomonas sp. HMSC10F06]OFS93136.1 hypothetical protein HMPREF3113_10330 [Stenotrophomonas sp. HMSC10F06]